MKTSIFKRVFAVALLMLVTGSIFAFDPVVRLTGSNKLVLKLDNENETVQLRISDNDGLTLLSETIEKSKSSYIKTFDLANLPVGSYKVELESDMKINSFPFTLGEKKVTSVELKKDETFKPIVYTRKDKLFVSKYNPEKCPLTITIFDKEDNIVYEETLDGEVKLGKIFDFSKVKGEYIIAMDCNERSYRQNILFR